MKTQSSLLEAFLGFRPYCRTYILVEKETMLDDWEGLVSVVFTVQSVPMLGSIRIV